MMKIAKVLVVAAVLGTLAAPVRAETVGGTGAVGDAPLAKAIAIVGACLGAGLCSIAGAIGIGRIGSACTESMARQPEAAGAMFAPMVVSAAMVEGGMLFAIVVCLLGVLYI